MTMSRWVVTGVSGSERIEFLNEIAEGVRRRSKTVEVYDVGQLISEECERLRIVTVDSRMLDKTSAVHLVMEEYNNKCYEAPFSSMLGLNKTAARGVISWLDQVCHAGEFLGTCLCG